MMSPFNFQAIAGVGTPSVSQGTRIATSPLTPVSVLESSESIVGATVQQNYYYYILLFILI